MKAGGAVAVGASVTNSTAVATDAKPKQESLALHGGPRTVTVDGSGSRWPLYGEVEERAVLELLHCQSGTEIVYSQGGYEMGIVSRVGPQVEKVLRDAMKQLLDESKEGLDQ